ncbi:MAG: glycosyltransferase family 2 protein [Acidimicrobiales bacterium]
MSAPTKALSAADVRTRWGQWWGRQNGLLAYLIGAAFGWGVLYLGWRAWFSWRGANVALAAALGFCELCGWWSLGTLAWFSWKPSRGPVRPPATPGHRVDVYICTYDEGVDVLGPTLAGTRAITYPHTTYLLDDGRRPHIKALAERYGARYMIRPDNNHAKAGNINHALAKTDGELVFILDADHVPMPDALDALVGYFDDPHVAVVQSTHDFFNCDSVQHYARRRHEQSVFYEVICPGKDRHGAAFWCGSAAVIRRKALLEVGGVAVETIAEDFHTTMKMQRRGWTSHFHHEHLVQGLAPHDLAAYLLQRDRWARGNLSVFRTAESPLKRNGLRRIQRLSYFTSLAAYVAAPVRAITLGVLAATALTGALPMRATWAALFGLWAPATGLNLLMGSALCRGYMTVKEATHYELLTAEIHLRALRCLVKPKKAVFKVTPKEGIDLGGWTALRQLPLLLTLAVLLGAGLLWRAVALTGLVPAPGLPGIAQVLVPILCGVELRRLVRTLRSISHRRQRRLEYRFACNVVATATVGDRALAAQVVDLTVHGAGLLLEERVEKGAAIRVRAVAPNLSGGCSPIVIEGTVAGCWPAGDRFKVGVLAKASDPESERRLIEFCFIVSPFEELRGRRPDFPPEPTPRLALSAAAQLALGALEQREREEAAVAELVAAGTPAGHLTLTPTALAALAAADPAGADQLEALLLLAAREATERHLHELARREQETKARHADAAPLDRAPLDLAAAA